MAAYAAQLEQYQKAIEIFEQVRLLSAQLPAEGILNLLFKFNFYLVMIFIEIEFTYHVIQPLKECASVSLRIFTKLCNKHHCLVLEYFHHCTKKSHPPLLPVPWCVSPWTWNLGCGGPTVGFEHPWTLVSQWSWNQFPLYIVG